MTATPDTVSLSVHRRVCDELRACEEALDSERATCADLRRKLAGAAGRIAALVSEMDDAVYGEPRS